MRNKLIQIALGLGFLVLLLQVVLIAPSRIRDHNEPSEAKSSAAPAQALNAVPDVDKRIDGMHMIETQEGAKEWELWSDKATSFKTKEVLELEMVKAIFFSESGVTFTVTGKRGRVQTKSKDLHVDGDVVTRSSNGYIFRTPSVDYQSSARKLFAPGNVEMDGPEDEAGHRLKLTGAVMEASLKASSIEIRRDVKAEKSLEKNRTAFIRSQRAMFSGKDRTANFRGDVILDIDSMRITGPAAHFVYDNKGDTVRSVLFTGGARVSDADKFATAQNVKVDFEENRFVFRGDPRVVQNNDELRGEEIVFLDGGKRVQVKSARAKVDEKRLEKVN